MSETEKLPFFTPMSVATEPKSAVTEVSETELKRLQEEFEAAKNRLLEARRSQKPELVRDYELLGTWSVKMKLSDMFGEKSELIVVHNMGKRCTYCTLWADGLNGFIAHLENRAGFVLTSPDDPETQRAFANDRGWKFRMLSTKGTTFTHDMGYEPEPGTYWPGFSVFRKDSDGKIYRTSKDIFGPGDLYCSVWHLFDLLPLGVNDWEPKYHYQA